MARFRKSTKRKMLPVTRQLARLSGELTSVVTRFDHLIQDSIPKLELEAEALKVAKQTNNKNREETINLIHEFVTGTIYCTVLCSCGKEVYPEPTKEQIGVWLDKRETERQAEFERRLTEDEVFGVKPIAEVPL